MENGTPRHDASQDGAARHTLSVVEALTIFEQAGVPRSARTIHRYCRSGILACIRTDTELGERFLIDRTSVDNRIEHLQKLQHLLETTSVATRPDVTRYDGSGRAAARSDSPRRDDDDTAPDIRKLEEEVLHLKIDNRAKEIVINQLVDERKSFVGQITQQAKQIGELGTRLRQLIAPRPSSEGELPATTAMDGSIGSIEQEGDNPSENSSAAV